MRIFIFIVAIALTSCSSTKKVITHRIFLDNAMGTSVQRQSFEVINEKFTRINSLPYRTISHALADSAFTDDERRIRQGVILKAKSKRTFSDNRRCVITDGSDTLSIFYSCTIDEETTGRSAARSVYNLLSKKKDRVPQNDPETYIETMELRGVMVLRQDTFRFKYNGEAGQQKANYPYQLRPDGYLSLTNGSVSVEPVHYQINNLNQRSSVTPGTRSGFLIKDLKGVVGAAGLLEQPGGFYFADHLNKDDKLLVAGFLIVATSNL